MSEEEEELPYMDAPDSPASAERRISLGSYPVSKGYVPKALKKKENELKKAQTRLGIENQPKSDGILKSSFSNRTIPSIVEQTSEETKHEKETQVTKSTKSLKSTPNINIQSASNINP